MGFSGFAAKYGKRENVSETPFHGVDSDSNSLGGKFKNLKL